MHNVLDVVLRFFRVSNSAYNLTLFQGPSEVKMLILYLNITLHAQTKCDKIALSWKTKKEEEKIQTTHLTEEFYFSSSTEAAFFGQCFQLIQPCVMNDPEKKGLHVFSNLIFVHLKTGI